MKRTVKFTISHPVSCILLLIVLLSAALFIGFHKAPALAPVDYGQYETYLTWNGLDWTDEDQANLDSIQLTMPVKTYQYAHFSWMKLLTPQVSSSAVYVTALIRIFTEPFGIPCHTAALAFVWSLLLVLGGVLLTVGVWHIHPKAAFLPPLILIFIYTDGNFCAIFRGLYPQNAFIAYLLLYGGTTLCLLSSEKKYTPGTLFTYVITAGLFLLSCPTAAYFFPTIWVLSFFVFRKHWKKKQVLFPVLCAFLIFTQTINACLILTEDTGYNSDQSHYEAVFHIMLPASNDPEEMLTYFGLDASYAKDSGRSYFDDDSAFVHNPHDEDESTKLFSQIDTQHILLAYLHHPDVLLKAMDSLLASCGSGYLNVRNASFTETKAGYRTHSLDTNLFSGITDLIAPDYTRFVLLTIIAVAWFILRAVTTRWKKWLLAILFPANSLIYLPLCTALNGSLYFSQNYLTWSFMRDCFAGINLGIVLYLLYLFEVWVYENVQGRDAADTEAIILTKPVMPSALARLGRAVKRLILTIADSRKKTVFLAGFVALVMTVCIYAPSSHPVCVNNTDFERVMNSIGVWYTGDALNDESLRYNSITYEDYSWKEPFSWKKLTPLEPTYGAYWFVSLSRIFTEPFGKTMSTYLVAWLKSIITILCVMSVLWDLWPLLHRWTITAACLLISLFFSEASLSWYNGLFGEGDILIGLVMMLTAALHIALMERHGIWKRTVWFLFYVISAYIAVTGKTQMILAMPFILLLFFFLLWNHMGDRLWKRILQIATFLALSAVIATGSLGIMQSERKGETNYATKANLWQTFFLGIFVISDDPVSDMEELGIDTDMVKYIGKDATYFVEEEGVYAPYTQEAEEKFLPYVNNSVVIRWYLTHPSKLWYMMNIAAKNAHTTYLDYRMYKGQQFSNHDTVDRFGFWTYLRNSFAPLHFLGYVLIYGTLLVLMIVRSVRFRKGKIRDDRQKTLLIQLLFCLMMIGVLQYAMAVIGNGMADVQKEMYVFELCHDLVIQVCLLIITRALWKRDRQH